MRRVITLFIFIIWTYWTPATQLNFVPIGQSNLWNNFQVLPQNQDPAQSQTQTGYSQFWSNLAINNKPGLSSYYHQLVPLNPHYFSYQYHPTQEQSKFSNLPQANSFQNNGNRGQGSTPSVSDLDDTVVIGVDDSYLKNSLPSVSLKWNQDSPSFQRGQIESIPRPISLEYVAGQNSDIAWQGFKRGHVEQKHHPNGILTKNAPKTLGFSRAAVEAQPFSRATSYRSSVGPRVVCYFGNWAWYRKGSGQYTPENVDPELCTHVIYAFATYNRNTFVITESDSEVDIAQRLIKRMVALKQKNPKLKVLIAIGGWADSGDNKYSVLANSPQNRKTFARESVAYLRKYDLDGMSLEWHYPVCWQSDCSLGPSSDKYGFSELLKELRSAFEPQGLILAASLSGYKEVIDSAYDVQKISQSLDFMNIMTYDYHGSWEPRTGHISPLYEGPPSEDLKPTYNSNFTMEYYVSKGADRSKLIMGIPFYGQSFKLENKFDQSLGGLADGPGKAGEATQQPGMLAYYEICKRVRESGWTVRRDSSGSWGPYAFKDDQWVGYDDMDSIRRKARHVLTTQFGGIFAFTLDLDDFQNICCNGDQPLLRTISKELLGIPFTTKRNDCSKPTSPPWGSMPSSTVGRQPTPTSSWFQSTTPSWTPSTNPWWAPSSTPAPQNSCYYSTKPHPTDCNAYYVCLQQQEMTQKCPFGLHWNRNRETCDWPSSAGCQDSTPTTLAPSWVQKPATSSPSWAQTPATKPLGGGGERCAYSGEFSNGPTCDQYYLCSNGIKKPQTCGPGLHWNNEGKLCDWPSNAKCKIRTETILDGKKRLVEVDRSHSRSRSDSQIPDKTRQPNGSIMLGDIVGRPCTQGEYTANKRSCEMYNMCVHGYYVEFRCQGGLYWNDDKKFCDWPQNVKCKTSSTPDAGSSFPTTTQFPSAATTQSSSGAGLFPWITQATTAATTTAPKPSVVTSAPEIVSPPTTTLSGDYKIVCYFTNWAMYRPEIGKYTPDNIDPDLCTHIVYGFAVLDYEKLTIKPHDTWADIDNRFYEQVTNYKRKGKKVSIAIGGWNDSEGDKYSRLVNDPSARARFIQTVLEFIAKYNFDGLDLDWEYPKCWQVDCDKGPVSDKANFANLVRELSDSFKPKGLLLTSAVSPSKAVIDAGYDVPTLSRYLDWIAVMTYDYHGQWDKKTGHVAPLYFHEGDDFYYFNANYTLNYWIQKGANSRKLVMGVPLYGQSFTLVNPSDHGLNAPSSAGGTAGPYTRSSGFLAYYEICYNIRQDGWTVVEDETGSMGPYAYKGNQWVSYDDVRMIRKKAELIRQLNLGGGMVWALDLDDFKNRCGQGNSPLLTTLRSILGRPSTQQPVTQQSVIKQPVTQQPAKQLTTKPTTIFPIRGEDVEHCDEPYRGDDKDCNKYYQCIFGRYVEQTCPQGTVWNVDHCDWPGNSNCGSTAPKPKPIATTTTTTTNRPADQFHSTAMIPDMTFTTERNPPPDWRTTTYSPPSVTPSRFSTTPTPTKDPEWCRLNWCPTEKPLPVNTHEIIKMPPSPYKVVCYFTNWAWYRPGIGKYKPEDIDFNLCTHIAYGFAVLNPTTLVIRPHDSWADMDNRFYKQVAQLRSRGIKVVLALGGWNDSLGDKYSRLANDPEARRRFIAHAIEFIETWDFDGLDLDWEYPKCWQVDCDKGPASDKAAFASLVRELSDAFRPRGLLLSAAVSPNKKVVDEGYDVPTVSRYLDWIAVMTYDYHGQWDKKTGHNAPLYHHPESDNPFFNANYSINYWIDQGADRQKIIMGMPMYGQSFTIVDPSNTGLNSKSSGGAQAGAFTRSAGFLAYYEICNYVRTNGWTIVQDEDRRIGPYAYKGNQWVSFDDVEQIRKKSEYIKSMGLGGGMIWALDLDDFRGVCGCEEHPLLRTINRVLRNYPVPDPQCKLTRS